MDYPILIEGERAGTLRAWQDGLYTAFEARLASRRELTRLYLIGGGESRCLGLMEPRPEGLVLRRRLSRAQLPPCIEFASDRPADPPPEGTWQEKGGGVLLDESAGLLAIPARLHPGEKRLRRLRIGGKEYVVFRI